MAMPDYRLCDVCGGKCQSSLFVETNYAFNGVENVSDGEHLDLCGKCAVECLKAMLKLPNNHRVNDHDAGNRLLEWVKQQKKVRT